MPPDDTRPRRRWTLVLTWAATLAVALLLPLIERSTKAGERGHDRDRADRAEAA